MLPFFVSLLLSRLLSLFDGGLYSGTMAYCGFGQVNDEPSNTMRKPQRSSSQASSLLSRCSSCIGGRCWADAAAARPNSGDLMVPCAQGRSLWHCLRTGMWERLPTTATCFRVVGTPPAATAQEDCSAGLSSIFSTVWYAGTSSCLSTTDPIGP